MAEISGFVFFHYQFIKRIYPPLSGLDVTALPLVWIAGHIFEKNPFKVGYFNIALMGRPKIFSLKFSFLKEN